MFAGMLSSFEEGEVARRGIRDLDMSLFIYNVFGMTVFYFFAGHVLTMLTGVDSFTPERLRAATGEIKTLVFEGIRSA
jgi:hypothetical protein